MYAGFSIRKPFFELGPKVYLWGDKALELALCADELVERHGVDIIFTAQYTDIARIAARTRHIKVFAQHMDPVKPGRGVGKALAEALKSAGAQGVLLNHAEAPLSLGALHAAIRRADEVGLATLVCAGTAEECRAAACLRPNILLAESPALIGTGRRGEDDRAEIAAIHAAVRSIDPCLPVLHGAGIADEKDVRQVIAAGADATGSTSGVLCAPDPGAMLEAMIKAVADAWRGRQATEGKE